MYNVQRVNMDQTTSVAPRNKPNQPKKINHHESFLIKYGIEMDGFAKSKPHAVFPLKANA